MIVYRLDREKWRKTVLSGTRAAEVGGRWNLPGTKTIYTSASISLTILEVLVHLDLSEDFPNDRILVSIDLPDNLKIIQLEKKQLPKCWNKFPHHYDSQTIFSQFVDEKKGAILKVPSAIVPEEFNYLLNPKHPDFEKISIIKIESYLFDQRLY